MQAPYHPIFKQKIQYSEIIFIFLAFYVIYQIFHRKITLIKIPFLSSLIFLLIAFFISVIRCNPHIGDFIEYFGIVYLVLLYILIVLLIRDETEWYNCINVWIGVSTFICVIGILGYIYAFTTGRPNILVPILNPVSQIATFPKLLQFQLRISSTLRNPNMFCLYLITGVTFILLAIRKRMVENRKYKGYLFILYIHLFSALLTKSRITTGILFLLVLSLFIFDPWKKYAYFRIIVSFFVIFYSLLAFITLVIRVFPIQLEPFKINTKNSEYFLQSKAGFQMWKDYPFFGIGPGRYNYNLEKYFDWENAKVSLFEPENPAWKVKDPHSTYFGWAAETGSLGLLSILIFLFLHLQMSIQIKSLRIIAGGIIAFLIAGFTADILTLRPLWFILGMSSAYYNILRKSYRSIL